MTNAIRVLEAMGGQPALFAAGHLADDALTLEYRQQQALLACDSATLNELLGGNTKMFCYIATPQKDAPDSAPDQDGGEDEGRELPDESPPQEK